jgi:hypothetical protein
MQLKSKSVLLALIAVFAMSAVAASAASAALPEFKPMPAKKKFTGTGGGLVWRFATAADDMTCSNSTATGEITGVSTIGKTVLKFTGCNFEQGEKGPCPIHSTNTTKAGEIVTDALKGELGTVKTTEAPSGVGMLLKAESNHELLILAPLSSPCTMPEIAFEGSIAGEVATIGKKQLTNELAFAPVSPTGKQKISEITVKGGTVKPKLLTYGAAETSMEWSDATTFEEALEVTL